MNIFISNLFPRTGAFMFNYLSHPVTMKLLYSLLPALLLLNTCGSDDHKATPDKSVTHGSYDFEISGTAGGPYEIKSDNAKTNWDADAGYIFCNTDDKNEPLGTLTLTISSVNPDGNAIILDAIVSKTDVRVGTAEELNARTFLITPRDTDPEADYTGSNGFITDAEIGSNYIKANFTMQMYRQIFWPDQEPESVKVSGTFTAVK